MIYTIKKNITILSLIGLFTFALLGCGGGSSAKSPITVITPAPSVTVNDNSIVVGDNDISSQQAVELVLFYPNEIISNINWQQSSGSSVNFLTKQSKVIAFTPPNAGDYSFTATFTVNGEQKELSKTITVNSNNSMLSARLGHAVIEGNKVSLRAWLNNSLNKDSLTWQQIAGPTVTLTNYKQGDKAIFFTAPSVTKDTVLQFSVQANNGSTTYTDTVAVLVENGSNINTNAYFDNRVAKVFPYQANSTYANNLVACVYNNSLTSSCTLGTLPLIAQQTSTPTVDDIMSRVVVSHQWMGDRFKEFLTQYDTNNDFKNLLRATTAIVISYDVRPSFYWAATGAIYLDANNFWLTPDERDTINEAPDYRAAFGNDLQFVMPWRYVINNDYASAYIASDSRVTRTGQDGLYRLSSLLFHELAHANDFLPSTEWFSYNSNTRVLDAACTNQQCSDVESSILANSYPLQSETMRQLAKVSFAGASANDTQKAFLPSDISSFFSPDGATDYYNFSSLREDYAMLFEEVMMYTRYNIQRDVAVTNQPTGDVVYANDYIVNWGQRGRAGNNNIKPRANFVVQRVLPELDHDSIINALPQPVEMISGNDWIKNLVLSNAPKTIAKALVSAKSTNNNLTPIQQHRYFHKALPKH
ncbi:MAG: hypothetical protein JKX78_09335 [Alteromonadaceae bacterium]|nr:hypothetical protein [Alteromonadaceae bacterium]